MPGCECKPELIWSISFNMEKSGQWLLQPRSVWDSGHFAIPF